MAKFIIDHIWYELDGDALPEHYPLAGAVVEVSDEEIEDLKEYFPPEEDDQEYVAELSMLIGKRILWDYDVDHLISEFDWDCFQE